MDCNFISPIDLAQIGIPIAAKSIEKVSLQSKFGLIYPDSENISLCVMYNFKDFEVR